MTFFLIFGKNLGYIKKSSKFQVFILVPGVRKNDFYDFSGNFLRKNELEIRNHEWDDDYGITSETTIPESASELSDFPLRAGFLTGPTPKTGLMFDFATPRLARCTVELRRRFPATLQLSRSLFPLLARCRFPEPSSHSRFRNRRLTRDSVFPAHFFVKILQTNRKNHFFGLLGPK